MDMSVVAHVSTAFSQLHSHVTKVIFSDIRKKVSLRHLRILETYRFHIIEKDTH